MRRHNSDAAYPRRYVALAAERQLIAALMAGEVPDPRRAWPWLQSEDFYGDLMRRAFAILQDGPQSPEQLQGHLRQCGWTGDVAGVLRDCELVTPATSRRLLDEAAQLVHAQACRRRLRAATRSLRVLLDHSQPLWNEQLENALRAIRDCRGGATNQGQQQ